MKTFSKTPGNERAETINCPVCGSGPECHRLLYDYGDFRFRKCSGCSLVLQNPQPVHNDLAHRYDSSYFEYEIENEEAFFSLMELALSDIGFHEIDFSGFRQKKILDIGCATGRLLESFKNRGWDVAGLEICAPAADYGNRVRGVNILNCTLEEASIPEKSITVVHASHLFEHLTDPVSFLRRTRQILSDNGFLILVTPNIASFQGFIFKSAWRSLIADHMFLFSRKTLEKICVDNGFSLIRWKSWGGLAKGMAPGAVKGVFDRLAKITGLGDVMVMLFRKNF